VSYYTALTIYAEVGGIDRFGGDKEVVSYVGLKPVTRESGDSRIEEGISKRGSGRVRWLLVQAANTAVHTSNDEYLSRFLRPVSKPEELTESDRGSSSEDASIDVSMLDRGEAYEPPGVTA